MIGVSVIGSKFEYSLRILLLLAEATGKSLRASEICLYDFVAVHTNDFGFQNENLHGYGRYRFAEYFTMKRDVYPVLEKLVRSGYVRLNTVGSSAQYGISSEGVDVCRRMTDEYSREYAQLVKKVMSKIGAEDISSTDAQIQKKMYEMVGDIKDG